MIAVNLRISITVSKSAKNPAPTIMEVVIYLKRKIVSEMVQILLIFVLKHVKAL